MSERTLLAADSDSALPPALRAELLAQADRLIAAGRPLPAYDLTKRLLAAQPEDDEVRLRNAHALRRCGALTLALATLDAIGGERPDPTGELRGLRAAVHKELFARRPGSAAAAENLATAQRLYQEVFEESRGTQYWQGINAATLALLLGREPLARGLAERVLAACAPAGDEADYWLLATRAEAALVLGRFDAAADAYRRAVAVAGERIGDVASTRQNAALVLDAYRPAAADRRAIEHALRAPAVVVFAGLRADRDGMETGLSEAQCDAVRPVIDERLSALRAGFGFSGAAPGAELVFVEAMLARSPGVASVVLPWPREQFGATHVRAAGGGWQRRFDDLLGGNGRPPKVHHVVSATLGVGLDGPLYERFAQQLLFGLARLHARTLATDVVPLVVSDRASGGDIDALVALWESQGVQLAEENVIEIPARVRGRPRAHVVSADDERQNRAQTAFRVMAILFADVEDYSKIPEDRLPSFIEHFVGGVASRLGSQPYRAENVRRVGDGLLMVFARVGDAAACALDLVEWVADGSRAGADGTTHWSRVGLPKEMRVRVALHAGPIFECVDPLTHAPAFEGAHVNYAARIEPVTPGNQVYASEAFAALAASWPEPCDEFVCEYVGQTSLAKKFGEYPLYHLRRRG
jgi:hypothetical protein